MSLAAYASSEFRSRETAEPEPAKYVLKLGAFEVDASCSARVTVDDNTNSGGAGGVREEGVGQQSDLALHLFWPVSPAYTLNTQVNVGYLHYISGDGADGWMVSSDEGETFALDMRVGENGLLSLLDTVSLNVDSVDVRAQQNSDSESLSLLRNDLALQYEVDLSVYCSAGFRVGRQEVRAYGPAEYGNRDLGMTYGAANLSWDVNDALAVGPYAAYRVYRHREKINNDATEYETGVQGAYRLTDVTQLQLSAGFQDQRFDSGNDPKTTGDARGVTGRVALVSSLTDCLHHTLSLEFVRRLGVSPGVNSNEDTTLSYRLTWFVTGNLYTSLRTECLHSEEMADDGETSNTYLSRIEFGYLLSRSVSTFVDYTSTVRDSDDEQRQYRRNQATLGMRYDF